MLRDVVLGAVGGVAVDDHGLHGVVEEHVVVERDENSDDTADAVDTGVAFGDYYNHDIQDDILADNQHGPGFQEVDMMAVAGAVVVNGDTTDDTFGAVAVAAAAGIDAGDSLPRL